MNTSGLRIPPGDRVEDRAREFFDIVEEKRQVSRPVICPDCRTTIDWIDMPGFLSITPPPSNFDKAVAFRMIPVKLGSCDTCLRVFLYRLTPEEQTTLEDTMRGRTVVTTPASDVLRPHF